MKLKAEIVFRACGVGKYRTREASLFFLDGLSVSIPFKEAAELVGNLARGFEFHAEPVIVELKPLSKGE
jgi:hypothetical protein